MARVVRNRRSWWAALGLAIVAGVVIPLVVLAGSHGEFTATPYADVIRFEARGVASLQVQIFDLSGKKLWDSGVVSGQVVDWDRTNEWGERLAYGAYLYQAQGWNAQGELVLQKSGKLALLPGDKVQLQQAPQPGPLPTSSSSEETEALDSSLTLQPLSTINENLYITKPGALLQLKTTDNSLWPQIMFRNEANVLKGAFTYKSNQDVFTLRKMSADGAQNERTKLELYDSKIALLGGPVGIGTTSPQEELHVHGAFPQVRLSNTWNNNWFTMGTGAVGWSLDSNFGTEPFGVEYQAPDWSLWVDWDGTVGVGTGSPLAGLHVRKELDDWELRLTETGDTTSDRSVILFDNPSVDWALGVNAGYDTFFLWYDPGGVSRDIIQAWYDQVNAIGWVEIFDNLYVANYCDFWDVDVFNDLNVYGTKNFVEQHPTDPTKVIVYAALEGPEAGTYIRGTAELVNGEAVIYLPEHFRFVTEEEGLTVQLTPVGEWLQLYIVEKSPERIVVREASGKSGQFDYLVQGIRKGYANFEVIRSAAGLARAETRIQRESKQGGAPPGEAPAVVPEKKADSGLNVQ